MKLDENQPIKKTGNLETGTKKSVAENWELIDDKKMTRKKQKATLEN